MTELSADLRKLPSLPLLFGLVASVVLALISLRVFLDGAAGNLAHAQEEMRFLAEGPTAEICRYVSDSTGRSCTVLLRERVASAEDWYRTLDRGYQIRAAAVDPLGAGGIAAGFAATFAGALGIATAAATHVAGEWRQGTASAIFTTDPRRWRFVGTKFLSTFIVGVVFFAVVWLVIAALGRLLYSGAGLGPSPPFDGSGYLLRQAPRSLLIISFFSSVGTAFAVMSRRGLASLLLTLGALGMSCLVAFLGGSWSPAAWISSLMQFHPGAAFGDHLWVDQGFSWSSQGVAALAIVASTVALLGLATAFMRLAPSDR